MDYKINMSTFNEILMTSNKKMIVSLIARNQERVQKEIFSSIEKNSKTTAIDAQIKFVRYVQYQILFQLSILLTF